VDKPSVIVLGGPNGAGKSTAAAVILPNWLGLKEFVNADVIARGLSAFNPEGVSLEAGKIMLRRLKALAAARETFAFETTLASRTFAPWLRELAEAGYDVRLLYFWLPDPEAAIQRVADRVRLGGHHVPPDTIRRRYGRGLINFFELYRPLATSWRFYDNSLRTGSRLVASADHGSEHIEDALLWDRIVKEFANG
jgi:predicted ABC-type ATPase